MSKRLLVVSPRFLFPLDQGGRIRTANTLRHMKGGAFHITLASPAPPDAARFAAETARVCDSFLSWPEPRPGLLGKLAALAGAVPVSIAGDASAEGRRIVAAALAERPDVALVDFPHAAILLPPGIGVPSVMFTHNVEAEIFARHAEVARFPMRPVWQHEARKMRNFEGDALRRFDRVIAVSARDARALERAYAIPRVFEIETGVDTGYYEFHPRRADVASGGGTIVFTGSMDSRSNIDGIEFLMNDVWPLILRRRPEARAVIAGRNPAPHLVSASASRGLAWTFTGFVDDVRPHVADADAYVIPLRVGSGTRIKVFEAMAMGCPVVSTTLGAEGLGVVPGEHLAIADDAASFADAVLGLLDGPARARSLATAARALVETRYSWATVTRRFETICLEAGSPNPT